ncbi:2OG-Fe(II) oxygenase [Streptomyces sp. NPDC001455]|uniref:2OG-Fe(II) oxygenase n=1 Tax=unclassified Streptomyces TaxID=2593676 RepID=UPI00331ECC49
MLSLSAFENAKMQDDPYRWGTVTESFDSPRTALAVAREFPLAHLRLRTARAGAEKEYRMLSAPLVDQGRELPLTRRLTPIWRGLVDELRTPAFTTAVSRAAGVELADATLEIRASCYTEGCFLGPHTDRSDKLVSLILYLSTHWSAADGGELSILCSSDPDDEDARVEPRLGTAAVLVRSDRSWHQVLPVRRPVQRRSLLVHYWA